ncbi:MAG: DUF3224 domain-containing protein [Steroidobacteraceae bacterium]
MNASGHFDVKLEPQKADNPHAQAANLLRMSIYKQFSGAIEGTSNGEMLATRDAQDSGAYVAIEKITGSLLGRRGSFVLRHSGEMSRGVVQNWLVAVVPDSGTEQLQGLTGTMKIAVDEGRHSYDFTYTLPEP